MLNKVSLVWLIGGTYINNSVRLEIWCVKDLLLCANNRFQTGYMFFETIKPSNIWKCIFHHDRYAAFGLLLIVPEAVALIKVLWNTSFIKRTRTHQWPSGVALFVVCTNSILINPEYTIIFKEFSSFSIFFLSNSYNECLPIAGYYIYYFRECW